MEDKEYKFGYIGAFTICASNEIMAQQKLIDWLHKCPYGVLDMGRFLKSDKTYEKLNDLIAEKNPHGEDEPVNYDALYNKGNDCDACGNSYMYGLDGTSSGCKCKDEKRECDFLDSEKEEERQKNAYILKMLTMKESEINEIFDCGMFNSVVEGFLVLVLKDLKMDNELIEQARGDLRQLFDLMTAAEVRKLI